MGAWSKDNRSHVATMRDGDFRSTERSVTMDADDELRIEYVAADGAATVLKGSIAVLEGEVVDGAVMRARALDAFLQEQIADTKEQGLLFSLHLKATMMKVSDPIIFGHAVRAFFAGVFTEHHDALEELGASPNNGLGAILSALDELPQDEGDAIRAAIEKTYETAPDLSMVDSDRGITNLHVPSDVIIDASMPAMIRASGQLWNAKGDQQDTKAVIPDHSYAALYAETIDFCREHGAFDPATMGTTPNVGLMAQKAEEYGSHDKTFEIAANGRVRVVDSAGNTLIEHEVEAGDIWRACQTKDAPIRDWVRLAVERARATGAPAVFWLDRTRAHDVEILKKVEAYLADHDTDGPADRDPAGRRGDALHARARQARRGHDLGHRQRPARLPDRPVPDPRARHEREDALGRAADERRRAVRDRRRRLGAQARPAAGEGEPPALGLARRVPRAGRRRSSSWPTRPTTRAPACWRRRSTRRPGSCSRTASRRSARSTSSTTAAATSTSRCTGRRRWPNQFDDSELADAFKPLAERAGEPGGGDRGRARRGPGRAGGPRRLLLRRPREGRRGDAPERDVQHGDNASSAA